MRIRLICFHVLVRMHAWARERGVKMGPGNCLPLVDGGTRE